MDSTFIAASPRKGVTGRYSHQQEAHNFSAAKLLEKPGKI
ncbi:hypothetical protein THTE_3158 [Thermogutta terrifontis]|uniref:Uncharacterized protein n=1 Tax=Thermogutta terrifontis TaxID=1331910 RepID=A0A286RIH3_9BACT|nr:hypothetical protein THTE_3158 [Thermogutta terrifontis]